MTHIANELRQQGYECDVRDLTAVHHSLNLSAYNKVLVGHQLDMAILIKYWINLLPNTFLN